MPILRLPAKPPPLLFIFSNPPIMPLLGYLLKRIRKQPYVLLVLDIYPNVLVQMGKLAATGMVARIWRRANRLGFDYADAIFTLTPGMARNIHAMISPAKRAGTFVQVVPPWVDTDFIKPLPKPQNWFAAQYGQSDKFTLLYSGNMGVTHDLETVLKGAKVFAEGDLDFRGTLGVSKDAPVGFQRIRLQITLDTDASDEQLGNLMRLTEKYCVVYQTLAHPPSLVVTRAAATT